MMGSYEVALFSHSEETVREASVLQNVVDHAPMEMPWEDYDDGGGFDDDASLIEKIPTLADWIKVAGYRELLGFEEG